jgi:hypothetical protein
MEIVGAQGSMKRNGSSVSLQPLFVLSYLAFISISLQSPLPGRTILDIVLPSQSCFVC